MLWNPEACQQCGQTCSPTAALGLSPQPGFLLLPLGASDAGLVPTCLLLGSHSVLPPRREEGHHLVLGMLLGKRGQLQCWEEKESAALASFHLRSPRAAAPLVSSLSQACTKFMIRSGELRGSVERALAEEEKNPP